MKIMFQRCLELLKVGNTPYMKGPPGIGKTQTASKLADALNLEFLDVRLSDYNATDLAGYPFVENRKVYIADVDDRIFPLEYTPVPDGKDGWLILLDEITTAEHDTLKVALRILNEHAIGKVKLHPKARFIVAGNPAGDGSMGYTLPDAIIDRMAVLECDYNFDTWMDWAKENNLNQGMLAVLEKNRIQKDSFGPDKEHRDQPFITPRSLEQLSRYLDAGFEDLAVMKAIVGTKMNNQLQRILEGIYADMPAELEPFRYLISQMDDINASALVSAILESDNGKEIMEKNKEWVLKNTPVRESHIQEAVGLKAYVENERKSL